MFRRLYHVSHTAFCVNKQGVRLHKMLNPKTKKKRFHNAFDVAPTTHTLAKTTNEPGKRAIRRVAVLNKLFMKYITDLLSTGNLADILGRGIEISKVKITPNYRLINVFWVCKGTLNDAETERILNNTAGALRHEMSTLRLMGEVPYIQFVKDRQEAVFYDLNRRLATADYGDEYVPTDPGQVLKSQFSLDTKLSPDMKAKIQQLEEQVPLEEVPIPEMVHTVYGLDHGKIMKRLLAARKKTEDAWGRLKDDNVISFRTTDSKKPIQDGNQRKELNEFLLQRQILENKIHKELQSSRHERNIALQELEDDYEEKYNDDQDDDVYDEDYYTDDEVDDTCETYKR